MVRIGAVNCMDDWQLCNQQQIQAFPSLIMYPSRQRFQQEKTVENLLYFALFISEHKYSNHVILRFTLYCLSYLKDTLTMI